MQPLKYFSVKWVENLYTSNFDLQVSPTPGKRENIKLLNDNLYTDIKGFSFCFSILFKLSVKMFYESEKVPNLKH